MGNYISLYVVYGQKTYNICKHTPYAEDYFKNPENAHKIATDAAQNIPVNDDWGGVSGAELKGETIHFRYNGRDCRCYQW